MSKTKTILGVDPGLADTGWGVVEKLGKSKFKSKDYGCIQTSSQTKVTDRLLKLYQKLSQIVEQYSPEQVAVERLFFGKNAKTAMKVGQARGVVLLVLADKGLETREFTPAEIKSALTGYGNASKKQIQKMVQQTLKLKTAPQPDHAADALAVAITAAVTQSWG